MSSIVNNLFVHCFERSLGRTKLRRSEAEQSIVILTCTILPGSHLKAYHLLIIELIPIERRNLGHHHSVNVFCTSLRVLVPLQRLRLHGDARGSCKQFVSLLRIGRTLSTLLFDTCSFSEVNMLVEKSLHCRRNHRIKHIIIREISLPHILDSTVWIGSAMK